MGNRSGKIIHGKRGMQDNDGKGAYLAALLSLTP